MDPHRASAPPSGAGFGVPVPVPVGLVDPTQLVANGANEQQQQQQLQHMQQMAQLAAPPATHQGFAAAGEGILTDPRVAAAMMDPNMMMSMGVADGGMGLDPQRYTGGDQFAPMSVTAPPGAMMGDYGTIGGGSTLTEFTKKRNWPQRVIYEIKDFLHILTPDGKIVYASPSSKALTGFEDEQLLGKFITSYIHEDDSALFVREFNESIATGRPLRLFYRFLKSDDSYAIFETHGHPHIADAPHMGPLALQSVCKGFFMMARPYPTRNAALLDSFLEHKIENERLLRRIADLRREESEDLQQQQKAREKARAEGAGSSFAGSETPMSTVQTPSSCDSMPPPAKPSSALTKQNLHRMEASDQSKIEGMPDKMARYHGTSHMDTIEIITGLHYREGERSKGISTGDTSPALIRGDVGVPIPIDKESRNTSDKKKKQKIAEEYVCTDCGTLDSPEWRKGPKGPKTLCNACGLRWAKKEKKRNTATAVAAPIIPVPPPGGGGSSLPG